VHTKIVWYIESFGATGVWSQLLYDKEHLHKYQLPPQRAIISFGEYIKNHYCDNSNDTIDEYNDRNGDGFIRILQYTKLPLQFATITITIRIECDSRPQTPADCIRTYLCISSAKEREEFDEPNSFVNLYLRPYEITEHMNDVNDDHSISFDDGNNIATSSSLVKHHQNLYPERNCINEDLITIQLSMNNLNERFVRFGVNEMFCYDAVPCPIDAEIELFKPRNCGLEATVLSVQ